MKALVLVVFTLLAATSAFAQAATPPVVPTTSPITIEWDSTQATSDVNFHALVDGAIVKNFLVADLTVTTTAATSTAPAFFTYRATIPAVKSGTHTLVLRADNVLGQQDSSPLTFFAAVPPVAPSLPRIIITVTAGGVTVDVKDNRQ